jgi:hypothetical protein
MGSCGSILGKYSASWLRRRRAESKKVICYRITCTCAAWRAFTPRPATVCARSIGSSRERIPSNRSSANTELVILHERLSRIDTIARHTNGWRGALDQLVATFEDGLDDRALQDWIQLADGVAAQRRRCWPGALARPLPWPLPPALLPIALPLPSPLLLSFPLPPAMPFVAPMAVASLPGPVVTNT